ncbi:MAG: hypothetical protein ABI878_05310, partial [Acidobacteriota bacterium]
GVYLSKVKVYEDRQEELAVNNNAVFAFLVDVSYKRRIFEVFLDAFLITLAYYASYALIFGSFEGTANWTLFVSTLPVLIVLKLSSFLVAGVYRGIWRYTGIGDLVTFAKGVFLGSGLSVLAILLLYRFQNFSRTVFVADTFILLMLIVGSRLAFRVFRQILPAGNPVDGKKVFIYGAGDGGEMLYRELRNNPAWEYQAVGFIDDDPLKLDKVIHGLRVFDANGTLPEILGSKDVQEILISFKEITPENLERMKEICRNSHISLRQAEMRIEPIDLD